MKTWLKNTLKTQFRKRGFDIVNYSNAGNIGENPLNDIRMLSDTRKLATLFDVGANIGQTIRDFRFHFPEAQIYSFEPSPSVYAELVDITKGTDQLKTFRLGVGSASGKLTFRENKHSNLSSFLEPGEKNWGSVINNVDVEVTTIDEFCAAERIDFIDVLKSDTQGFDFEVLKGALGMMKANKIAFIYTEITFSAMYKNMPAYHELLKFMEENHFSLVSFYDQQYQEDLVSWANILFVNNVYYAQFISK